jgi:hypothetical protein
MPEIEPKQSIAILHELIEALTSIGNYLAAAHHIFAAEPQRAQTIMGGALKNAQLQLYRANEAARQFRDFILAPGLE